MKSLSFAFSPCPNDTFMFEPMVSKRIGLEDLSFEYHLHDVEELNKAAFQKKYDITKLSYHAYGMLTHEYQLLQSGSALGRNCGPLLISKKQINLNDLSRYRIAIPGKHTTANFLLSFAFPQINQKVETIFSNVEQMVLNGEVDAGVIIHENRFTYQDRGLLKLLDLGENWESKTGNPIPLGGIAVKRSLPESVKQKVNNIVTSSVSYAFDHPTSGMEYIRCHAQEMDADVMMAHIKLYVNEYSKKLGEEGQQSVLHLLRQHPEVPFSSMNENLFVIGDQN